MAEFWIGFLVGIATAYLVWQFVTNDVAEDQ